MMVGWVVTNSNHPQMGQTSEIMDTDWESWNLADLWLSERQEKVIYQTSYRVHALPKGSRRCHMVFAIWNRLFWNKSQSTKPLFTHWRAKLSFSPLQEPKQHSEMTLQKQRVGNPGTIIHVGWSKEFGSLANWLHQKLTMTQCTQWLTMSRTLTCELPTVKIVVAQNVHNVSFHLVLPEGLMERGNWETIMNKKDETDSRKGKRLWWFSKRNKVIKGKKNIHVRSVPWLYVRKAGTARDARSKDRLLVERLRR